MEKNKETTQSKLGVVGPDYKDSRDYLLSTVQPDKVVLPLQYLLIPEMTSIQHQNWGTCTSHSVDGVKEFLDKKEYQKEIKLSQKFIYRQTKEISNLWGIQGDYLRNAIKAVCQYGACKEETFPDIRKNSWKEYISEKPSNEAYAEAEEFRGKTYWRVDPIINNIKQACYRNKRPLAISMMWYDSYFATAEDGKLPLPDKQVGGHAIIYVGWTEGKMWFRNSFGKDWGLNGYFYISESEWNKYSLWDAWIIEDFPYSIWIKMVGILRSLIALYQELIEKLTKK